MEKYTIIVHAERKDASEDFIKYLKEGYDMKRSLAYKNIVKSIKSDEDNLEDYIRRSGRFVTLLWEGKPEKAYNIADTENSRILEQSHKF
jgi:CRISPR/Cas system-associated protein endoribonuclease Cas2